MPYRIFNVVKGSLEKRLNDFIFSFGQGISDGRIISFADNDINYALRQQHERIKEKGLTVEYEVYERGVLTDVHAGGYERLGYHRTESKKGTLVINDRP